MNSVKNILCVFFLSLIIFFSSQITDNNHIVLSQEEMVSGWGFTRNPHHKTPSIGRYQEVIEDTDSFYVGDNPKHIYLTFDAGYDNGNLPIILDVLKEKDVRATFFVTGDFIKRFSSLLKTMVADGHVLANHSYSHRNINTLSKDSLLSDLKRLEDAYFGVTSQSMAKVFRPPAGEFDRESLLTLKTAGYKTFFWSIAFYDWDVNDQKGADYSYDCVINNLHPGAIILMHSVSKSNALALPRIIDEVHRQGLEFKLVTEL